MDFSSNQTDILYFIKMRKKTEQQIKRWMKSHTQLLLYICTYCEIEHIETIE